MYQIRTYTHEDFKMLKSWWDAAGKNCPPPVMFSTDSTYIFEIEGVPALSVTAYLTNSKGLAILEHFVGNPELKGADRRNASAFFINLVYDTLNVLGYQYVLGFATNDKLVKRYEELGMTQLSPNITSMIKVLGE